jgi:subtilase family serine protease
MRKRALGGAVLAVTVVVAGLVPATAAQAEPSTRAIANSTPGWLAHGKKLGAAPTSAPVAARVYLGPNGGLGALTAAAYAVSTPGSATYHQYLTAKQFHAKYDATDTTVQAVKDWLGAAGFKITKTEASNRYVDVAGTVANAQAAFGVQIGAYSHDGLTVQAPVGALTAPAALGDAVVAVDGVDTTPSVVAPKSQKPAPPPTLFKNAQPCSAYYGEKVDTAEPFDGAALPYAVCGYNANQLRGAYAGSSALTGSGVTVAITDAYASPTMLSDAKAYFAGKGGGQAFRSAQYSESLPNAFTRVNDGPHQCGENGWYGEETLDVEAVHAIAPDADIRYYAAASCYDRDFLDTFSRINDENRAKVVTNSWGDLGDSVKPATLGAYELAFAQGALEGISYLFSSGDDGDDTTTGGYPTPQTDYPASDPLVTGVGGTSTAIGANNSLGGMTGWSTNKWTRDATTGTWVNRTYLYGAGGGESKNIARPPYQPGSGGRLVPDVAMDADPTTGMLIGETQTNPYTAAVVFDYYRIGGTSLASPLFAGMVALRIQKTGSGEGLISPSIWTSHGAGFRDVTGNLADAGNVRVDYADGVDGEGAPGQFLHTVRTFGATFGTSQRTTAGWDDLTGFGVPTAAWFDPAN